MGGRKRVRLNVRLSSEGDNIALYSSYINHIIWEIPSCNNSVIKLKRSPQFGMLLKSTTAVCAAVVCLIRASFSRTKSSGPAGLWLDNTTPQTAPRSWHAPERWDVRADHMPLRSRREHVGERNEDGASTQQNEERKKMGPVEIRKSRSATGNKKKKQTEPTKAAKPSHKL